MAEYLTAVDQNPQRERNSQEGYALPSVIFILTILSVVILSILLLQHTRRQLVLREINQVKADFAAQNAIARLIAENPPLEGSIVSRHHEFADGSTADVEFMPWGCFALTRAIGRSGSHFERRSALLAGIPGSLYDNALVFTHPSHQLVLTGDARIRGDVLLGPQGVTTGSLPGVQTPRVLPIDGRIRQHSRSDVTAIDQAIVAAVRSRYDQLLADAWIALLEDPSQLSNIPDTVQLVRVRSGSIIRSSIERRWQPLTVVCDGSLTISDEAKLSGLIAIVAAGGLSVSSSATVEHGVLYSRSWVHVEAGASIVSQILAPEITLGTGTSARYPSAVVSFAADGSGSRREPVIELHDRALVEGVVVAASGDEQTMRSTLTIPSTASVVGMVINDGAMTLDGEVRGTLVSRQFFFYAAPTAYYGWIRGGRIDQTSRPEGVLLPLLSNDMAGLDLLDWL